MLCAGADKSAPLPMRINGSRLSSHGTWPLTNVKSRQHHIQSELRNAYFPEWLPSSVSQSSDSALVEPSLSMHWRRRRLLMLFEFSSEEKLQVGVGELPK
jgi:hypothetical protein